MKHTIKIITLLAAVVSLVACKPEEVTDVACERDIFYTVSDSPALSALSGHGNSVHLTTEAEWDSMLDRFCDYTLDGVQVIFCSTRPAGQSQAKGLDNSDTPTSITTSSRDELKAWMKEMEKAGKTVNIRYDDNTGTWNGRAYANISNNDSYGEPQNYTGTLVFVPVPVLDNPPLDGVAMALQVDDNETYIITIYGMIICFDTVVDRDFIQILQDTPAKFEGISGTHTDLNGNTFLSLDMVVPESGVIEF